MVSEARIAVPGPTIISTNVPIDLGGEDLEVRRAGRRRLGLRRHRRPASSAPGRTPRPTAAAAGCGRRRWRRMHRAVGGGGTLDTVSSSVRRGGRYLRRTKMAQPPRSGGASRADRPTPVVDTTAVQVRPLADRRRLRDHAAAARRRPRRVPRVVQGARRSGTPSATTSTLAQANCSVSAAGVLRGIHFSDVPPGQAKYVTCVRGAALDVVVDIRVGSPTFGQWDSVLLDDVDRRQIYLAEGLGHAFMSLADDTTVVYLCSTGYAPGREHGVHPLDPAIGIEWPTTGRDGVAARRRSCRTRTVRRRRWPRPRPRAAPPRTTSSPSVRRRAARGEPITQQSRTPETSEHLAGAARARPAPPCRRRPYGRRSPPSAPSQPPATHRARSAQRVAASAPALATRATGFGDRLEVLDVPARRARAPAARAAAASRAASAAPSGGSVRPLTTAMPSAITLDPPRAAHLAERREPVDDRLVAGLRLDGHPLERDDRRSGARWRHAPHPSRRASPPT